MQGPRTAPQSQRQGQPPAIATYPCHSHPGTSTALGTRAGAAHSCPVPYGKGGERTRHEFKQDENHPLEIREYLEFLLKLRKSFGNGKAAHGPTLWLFDGCRSRASVAGQGLAAAPMSDTPGSTAASTPSQQTQRGEGPAIPWIIPLSLNNLSFSHFPTCISAFTTASSTGDPAH